MVKFQNKYRIPSTRLQHWDYGQPAAYFVTICTKGRENHFGDVVNGKMNLSGVGIIADILWHEIKNHTQNIELGEFVVMPNHVHGILILNGNGTVETNNITDGDAYVDGGACVETTHALSLQSPQSQQSPQPPQQTIGQKRFQNQGKNTLSSIIGSYKSAVSKHAHRLGFNFAWQSRFYDHIIRNEQSFQTISEYIINNPSKWNDDKFNPTNKTAEE
ncbi:MAG TPA: transposase [Williamwhitmania sp.]|nr:transposase [Williamwhitmania sp.]